MICPVCGHSDNDGARSIRQNALYWSMLNLVSDHSDAVVFQGADGARNLHDTIKRALGYIEPMYDHNGDIVGYKAKSIAFHKMKQDQFSAFFDKVQNFVFEKILPNVEQESFERELCNMLQIMTPERG